MWDNYLYRYVFRNYYVVLFSLLKSSEEAILGGYDDTCP
jgi:hypothetical protein